MDATPKPTLGSPCHTGYLLLLLAFGTIQAHAQGYFHVKIVSLKGDVVKGTLLKAGKDSIVVFGRKNEPRAFHMLDIASIGIRREGAIGRGTGYGFLIGAATGALLALASESTCTSFCFSKGEAALGGAIVIAPLGAALGAAIGTGHKRFDLQKDPQQIDDFLWHVKN